MRYIISVSFFILMSFQSFGQDNKRLFEDGEINIQDLFLSPYYEYGEDRNHFGFGAALSIYKRFFVGAYKQWGDWKSPQDENDFESKYSHGGFWLGHIRPIKKSKFSIVTSCYLGIGKSTSKQNTPIDFTDAQIRFKVITPELGLEYRIINIGTLMLSTGYHSYSRIDHDDLPIGFNGFELNQYYAKLSVRIGM